MADLEGVLQQLREQRKLAQEQVQRLEAAISALGGSESKRQTRGRRTLSPAARKRIADAQRARWARFKAGKSHKKNRPEHRRTLSPQARKRIAAAQKRRWAKFRSQNKAK